MFRIFDNPHNIDSGVILSRLREVDPDAQCATYEFTNTETQVVTYYVAIDSSIADGPIENNLNNPTTTAEREEYQKTLDQLQLIADYANPTNAQVIAAVKYLARTLRLVIKLFIRYY